MTKNPGYKLGPIFLGARTVVFGVVLALAANGWLENRASRAPRRHIRETLLTEIEINRGLVEASRGKHKFKKLSECLDSGERDDVFYQGGFVTTSTTASGNRSVRQAPYAFWTMQTYWWPPLSTKHNKIKTPSQAGQAIRKRNRGGQKSTGMSGLERLTLFSPVVTI